MEVSLLNKIEESSVNKIEECPVCYNDLLDNGLVIPKSCTHKICIDCYSKIIIGKTNHNCPLCRTDYALLIDDKKEEKKIFVNVKIFCFRWHINLFRFQLN
jgi:hypothetical protein